MNEMAQFLTRCARSLSGAFLGLLNNRSMKSRLAGVGQVSRVKVQTYGLSGIIARSAGVFLDQRYFSVNGGSGVSVSSRTFMGKRGDNLDRFLIRVKETAESFRVLSQALQLLKFKPKHKFFHNSAGIGGALRTQVLNKQRSCYPEALGLVFNFFFLLSLHTLLTLDPVKTKHGELLTRFVSGFDTNFVQAMTNSARGKFSSMESLIAHFRLTSEG